MDILQDQLQGVIDNYEQLMGILRVFLRMFTSTLCKVMIIHLNFYVLFMTCLSITMIS